MGDSTGFMKHDRQLPSRREVPVRLRDWKEVYEDFPIAKVREQASRCMDCGIPFCNNGCPLGNLIPDWNDLVFQDRWRDAIDRLHATNNFPEFTGRLCPAPCEAACVVGITQDPVTIKQVEGEIIDRAWSEGWIEPQRSELRTGRSVAVVGSGPAGLATAQQLARAGHDVVVFERADRPGGLLRYGIPEFKMEKQHLDRRLAQLEAEGVEFRCNVDVGVDVTGDQLREQFDAVVLAGGATAARDLTIPGREFVGIHQAMEFLPLANRVQEGDLDRSPIHAEGKRVVIIGGGDTGADCLGTSHRQGAISVHQFEIMPRPSESRPAENPWPTWPIVYRTSSAHEEGGERVYAVNTLEFLGDNDGNLTGLRAVEVVSEIVEGRPTFVPVEGSEFEVPCDLVFLAMGFVGPESGGVLKQLGVDLDLRGNVARDESWSTNVDGVFVAGDMGRGQSLIVWAIAEGRSVAAAVDTWLMGGTMLINFSTLYLTRTFGLATSETFLPNMAILAATVVGNLVAVIPAGRLGDRFGRKKVIYLACLIAAAGMALCAAAPSIPVAVVGAALFGTGLGSFLSVDWALLTSVVPGASGGRYMGISNVATATAGIAAIATGGPLLDFVDASSRGDGPRAAFALAVVFLLAGILPLRKVREPGRD